MSLLNQAECYVIVMTLVHFLWLGCLPFLAWLIAMRVIGRDQLNTKYTVSVLTLTAMVAMVGVAFWMVPQQDRRIVSEKTATESPSNPQLAHGQGEIGSSIPPLSNPQSSNPQSSNPQSSNPHRSTLPNSTFPSVEIPPTTSEYISTTENPFEESNTYAYPSIESWAPLLTLAYLIGVCLFVIRMANGLRVARSLRRDATAVHQSWMLSSIQSTTSRVGLAANPVVLWCEKTVVPSVIGVISPVIVLPAALASGVAPDQLEHILLHEMMHLKRRDHIVNFLQNIVETLLFFHPLVWVVSNQIRLQRELCCDASVVQSGADAHQYASTLIEIALGGKNQGAAALSIGATSTRSHLRTRLQRLMGSTESKSSRLMVDGMGLMVIAVVVSALCLATIDSQSTTDSQSTAAPGDEQTAAQNDDKPTDDEAVTKDDSDAKASDEKETTNESELALPEDIGPTELAGVVVDESGKPLQGVTVDAWSWHTGDETETDENGVFRFKPASEGGRRKIEVRFIKEGYSPHYVAQQPVGVKALVIKMNDKSFIEGVVVNQNGDPVPGVTIRGEQRGIRGDGVMITEVSTTTVADRDGKYRLYVHPDNYFLSVAGELGVATIDNVLVTPGNGVKQNISLAPGVRFEAKVVDVLSGKPFKGLVLFNWRRKDVKAFSNENGKLVLTGLPPGKMQLNVGAGKSRKMRGMEFYSHGPLGRWWSPSAVNEWERKQIKPGEFQRNFDHFTFDMQTGMDPVEIFVERGVVFTGHVYDPDGNPRAGATVAPAKTGSGNSLTGDTRYSAKTKEDGSFRVVMPAGNAFEYNVIAHDGKYGELRKWAGTVTEPMKTKPGQKIEDLKLTLTRPATVRGKVTADGGRDVSKRKVRAHAADLRGNRYYDPTVNVNKDGSFELTGIRPGKHFIQVDPFWLSAANGPEGTSVTVEVEEGETIEGIELKVAANAEPSIPAMAHRDFTIEVVDAEGQPVPGATILDNSINQGTLFNGSASDVLDEMKKYSRKAKTTDDDGKVKLAGTDMFSRFTPVASIIAYDSTTDTVALQPVAMDRKDANVKITLRPLCEVTFPLDKTKIADDAQVMMGIVCQGANIGFFPADEAQTVALPPNEYVVYWSGQMVETGTAKFTVPTDETKFSPERISMKPSSLAKLVGKPAPEIESVVGWIDDNEQELADNRGKVILVDFWAHWCGPCIASMPNLIQLRDDYSEDDVQIIAVHDGTLSTIAELETKLKQFQSQNWNGRELPFPVVLSANETGEDNQTSVPLIKSYGITAFPTTVLIDQDGNVVTFVHPAELEKTKEKIDKLLKRVRN